MTTPRSAIGKRYPFSYYLLYLLPKNSFSRLCGWVAEQPWPPFFRQLLIRSFIRAFQVDMSEAMEPVERYPTFNAFFTRHLKPGTRPIDPNPTALICPVDGTIGEFGSITQGRLIQAKGLEYSLADLLDDPIRAQDYEGGEYMTIYLAPYNYHRIHSMVRGHIARFAYIPGKLWTVSPLGVNYVRNLFAINERLISYFETSGGECALVKVGATVVGKIRVKYHSIESNHWGAKRVEGPLHTPYRVEAGEEVGLFELGSTVVCVFKPGQVEWGNVEVGQAVRLGESLGTYHY